MSTSSTTAFDCLFCPAPATHVRVEVETERGRTYTTYHVFCDEHVPAAEVQREQALNPVAHWSQLQLWGNP